MNYDTFHYNDKIKNNLNKKKCQLLLSLFIKKNLFNIIVNYYY